MDFGERRRLPGISAFPLRRPARIRPVTRVKATAPASQFPARRAELRCAPRAHRFRAEARGDQPADPGSGAAAWLRHRYRRCAPHPALTRPRPRVHGRANDVRERQCQASRRVGVGRSDLVRICVHPSLHGWQWPVVAFPVSPDALPIRPAGRWRVAADLERRAQTRSKYLRTLQPFPYEGSDVSPGWTRIATSPPVVLPHPRTCGSA